MGGGATAGVHGQRLRRGAFSMVEHTELCLVAARDQVREEQTTVKTREKKGGNIQLTLKIC